VEKPGQVRPGDPHDLLHRRCLTESQLDVAEAIASASIVEEMLAPHDMITIAWPPER
jgi:hypothetical protein